MKQSSGNNMDKFNTQNCCTELWRLVINKDHDTTGTCLRMWTTVEPSSIEENQFSESP